MKKNLLFAIMVLIASTSFSQVIEKGDHLLGGSLRASITNDNPLGSPDSRNSNIGILPSYAIALRKNLAFGFRGYLSYYHNESTVGNANSLGTGLGVFLRKYKELKNRFGLYFDNSVSGYFTQYKQKGAGTYNSTSISKGIQFQFSPGVFYKFTENWFAEANIGGLNAGYFYSTGNRSFTAGINFLQSFNLGVNYRFMKKKV